MAEMQPEAECPWHDASVLVSLLPGADPQTVLGTLQERRRSLDNLRGNLRAYLEWADGGHRTLRRLIQRSDVDALLHTWRYRHLLGFAGQLAPETGIALNAEIDERREMLDLAISALTEEMSHWQIRSTGRIIVPDTNLFLHHPDKIHDIDYAAMTPKAGFRPSDGISVVLPILVVDELDNAKQSRDRHLRWRAGHTLGVLDELLISPRAPGLLREAQPSVPGDPWAPGKVTVEIFFDRPGHRRLPIEDDEIIARALEIQSLAGRPVHVITMDTHMSTRCRHAGLRVFKVAQDIGPEPAA
jgi:hypothetical protein